MFDAVSLIDAKRDGRELSTDDITGLVRAYMADEVSDAQMAALYMAGVIRGFTTAEAVAFAEAYLASGDTVDLSGLRGPTVDKHSTGGVADTTTFVVGPIVAACGLQLAKLSGRGLGHTGGTLDKLEAIPGMRVDLTPDEVAARVDRIGLAVAAATKDLVPADKRTYALRDVTGTVASEALIAASIMSKKVAGGADTIVLDVKVGDGAFLPDADAARSLARLCVDIGTAHGRRTAALVTDMSQPLGPAVGNALEVRAAIDVLTGQGTSPGHAALREVSLSLAAAMLDLAWGSGDGRARAEEALADGAAAESLRAMVEAQGGDPAVLDRPGEVLPAAPVVREVTAEAGGNVAAIACRHLGEVAVRLGAGRLRQGDPVDPAVGMVLHRRIGDPVAVGDVLGVVHARDADAADNAAAEVRAAFHLADGPVTPPTLVQDRVD